MRVQARNRVWWGVWFATALSTSVQVAGRSTVDNDCVNNLRQIDGAKEQVALARKLPESAVVSAADLAPYIKGGFPKCAGGGTYVIGKLSEEPRCSIAGHSFAEMQRRGEKANARIVRFAVAATVGFVVVVWLVAGMIVVYRRDRRAGTQQ
jgi:hypothetical protein